MTYKNQKIVIARYTVCGGSIVYIVIPYELGGGSMVYILIPYASRNIAGGGASTAQPLRTRRTARRSLSSTNIASTLANIISLIKEWSLIRTLNHRVSYLFCVYQIFLLT